MVFQFIFWLVLPAKVVMARHMISVCIFCFICATHSPCASHAAVGHVKQHLHQEYNDPNNPPSMDNLQKSSREKLKPNLTPVALINDDPANVSLHPEHSIKKFKRNSDINDSISKNRTNSNSEDIIVRNRKYLRKIFLKYGDGNTMTIEGFERLLLNLDAVQMGRHVEEQDLRVNQTRNESCTTPKQISTLIQASSDDQNKINQTTFLETCPLLLYNFIVGHQCLLAPNEFHVHEPVETDPNPGTNIYVWVYSITAVCVISACGILSLVIIPLMQNKIYKPLIQFLVALAVGTLAGDALLHLLPHAMSTGDGPHHHHHGEHGGHDNKMWKGFVAMMGLTFFFIMEKFIMFAGKWRKGKQKDDERHTRVKVVNEGRDTNHASDTQCMDKYNSYPYCYKDIINGPNKFLESSDKTATTVFDLGSNSDVLDITPGIRKSRSPTIEKMETNQNMTECPGDQANTSCTEVNKMLPSDPRRDSKDDYTVILRKHENDHHGHSHTHGHVHAPPRNFSSVAWMVIMGDGLHNFTDGMAIGAAFSGGMAGGFSTTVAVFCHELPHELGDFAMLLKAGMSIRQALFYNLLSSVLCILGNIVGVWLGNTEVASGWVFALAAGIFLYIALVDMIPELSSAHEDEGNFTQGILHLSGLLLGFGIMTVIALYEHDLKNIFNDPM